MKPTEGSSNSADRVSTLSDLIVKYDMALMIDEAQSEFEAIISSRELLDQNAIGDFFNLDDQTDARN